MVLTMALGLLSTGAQARALGQGLPSPHSGLVLSLCTLYCGFSAPVLFSQPYVPKKPPVLRVTEGPFFSEVAAYYEHFHQVIRLYNLPGEPCRWGGSQGDAGWHPFLFCPISADKQMCHLTWMFDSLAGKSNGLWPGSSQEGGGGAFPG